MGQWQAGEPELYPGPSQQSHQPIKSSSPCTQTAHTLVHVDEGAQRGNGGQGNPSIPEERSSHHHHHPTPAVPGEPQPHGLGDIHPRHQWGGSLECLTDLSDRCLHGYGTHYGTQGKNVLGLHKTVWDVSGGAKCGEREGSGQFGEEQVWENRRLKGQKGSALCEQWLVSKPVRALHLIGRVSPVSLLSSFSTLE